MKCLYGLSALLLAGFVLAAPAVEAAGSSGSSGSTFSSSSRSKSAKPVDSHYQQAENA